MTLFIFFIFSNTADSADAENSCGNDVSDEIEKISAEDDITKVDDDQDDDDEKVTLIIKCAPCAFFCMFDFKCKKRQK